MSDWRSVLQRENAIHSYIETAGIRISINQSFYLYQTTWIHINIREKIKKEWSINQLYTLHDRIVYL